MTFVPTLQIAVRALLRNKMRSLLTALGMIIGVAAVIAMVAIGEGAKSQVEKTFQAMGANLLVIVPGTTSSGGAHGGFGSMPTLTWGDLRAIQNEIPLVEDAAAAVRTNAQVLSEDFNWSTTVHGVTATYFDVRNWPIRLGSIFGQSEIDAAAKVVILGETVAQKLFVNSGQPIGKTVRIKNVPFEVIGVLKEKGQSPMGQDFDDAVFIPYTTYNAKIQGGLVQFISGTIYAAAINPQASAQAEQQISALLRERHRIQPGADDDFWVRNLGEMASAQQEGTKTLTTLLASIAAVSLLVGGIGIMNIMLVSVTERTREIGLRMAIGATRRDILQQFLLEALALALCGGCAGIGLGLFVAWKLSSLFMWPLLIRVDMVFIAMGFSLLIGVIFGVYPARRAARLNPIEALRYE